MTSHRSIDLYRRATSPKADCLERLLSNFAGFVNLGRMDVKSHVPYPQLNKSLNSYNHSNTMTSSTQHTASGNLPWNHQDQKQATAPNPPPSVGQWNRPLAPPLFSGSTLLPFLQLPLWTSYFEAGLKIIE